MATIEINKQIVDNLTGSFIGYVEDFNNYSIPRNEELLKLKEKMDSVFDELIEMDEVDVFELDDDERLNFENDYDIKEKECEEKRLRIKKELCKYCVDYFMSDQGYNDISDDDINYLVDSWFDYFNIV